ncbi:hypothetical protein [Caulobacter segnis]
MAPIGSLAPRWRGSY